MQDLGKEPYGPCCGPTGGRGGMRGDLPGENRRCGRHKEAEAQSRRRDQGTDRPHLNMFLQRNQPKARDHAHDEEP